MCGNYLLTLIAHGIARQVLAVNLTQAFKHAWRTPSGVFVEVEPQAYAIAQRRMIFLQRSYAFAGFKHERTSREWSQRAL
jgi:hypothetical protein